MKKAYAGIIIFMMVFILYGNNYIQVGKDDDFNDDNNCCDSWEITEGGSYASIINMNDYGCTVEGVAPGYAVLTSYPSDPEYNEDVCSSYDITVFEVEIENINSVCDGKSAQVKIKTTPTEISLDSVELEAKNSSGGTSFNNPDGQGITFTGSDKNWTIPNARWYQDGSDPNGCNWESTYKIGGKYTVDGKEYDFEEVDFIVKTDLIDGEAWVVSIHSGEPLFSITQNQSNYKFQFTGIGTFARLVVGSYTCFSTPTSSQYFKMIENEEKYHVKQFEGTVSCAINHQVHYSVSKVFNKLTQLQSQNYSTHTEANNAALNYVNTYLNEEIRDTNTIVNQLTVNAGSIRCTDEAGAKNAVGSTHLMRMKCAYKGYCGY